MLWTTGRQGSISQHALEISGLARASPLFISDQPPSNETISLKHILIEPVCYHSSSSHAYLFVMPCIWTTPCCSVPLPLSDITS